MGRARGPLSSWRASERQTPGWGLGDSMRYVYGPALNSDRLLTLRARDELRYCIWTVFPFAIYEPGLRIYLQQGKAGASPCVRLYIVMVSTLPFGFNSVL